ncbi:MAG: hypothetical protein HUJ91_02640, partial [Bacteroidales bacterium]|nr:hypothetical protein [Bacteroidales bacterium]
MKRIITITLLIAAAFVFAEGKPLRFARFSPMMQDKDTIVYKVDDAGNLILDSQGNSVIDTSETRIVRELIANSQDTL